MNYPRKLIRDTSRYKPFRVRYSGNRTPSLKKLVQEILGKSIQEDVHNSVRIDFIFQNSFD